jgi:hypothetical protein
MVASLQSCNSSSHLGLSGGDDNRTTRLLCRLSTSRCWGVHSHCWVSWVLMIVERACADHCQTQSVITGLPVGLPGRADERGMPVLAGQTSCFAMLPLYCTIGQITCNFACMGRTAPDICGNLNPEPCCKAFSVSAIFRHRGRKRRPRRRYDQNHGTATMGAMQVQCKHLKLKTTALKMKKI